MRRIMAAVGIAALLVALAPAPQASAEDPDSPPGPDARLIERLNPDRLALHSETGWVRFVGGSPSKPLHAASGTTNPLTAARAFLGTYGALYGLTAPDVELRARPVDDPIDGLSVVRFDQLYKGIPVIAGELAVQLDASGAVLAVSGETSPNLSLGIRPEISADQAAAEAVAASAKASGMAASSLDAATPTLAVYDARLVGGPGLPVPRLVWRTEVGTADQVWVHDFVAVDARTGGIALRFRDVESALERRICDRANVENSAACTGPYARVEGAPPTGNSDADDMYDYLGDTYVFYASRFGRDSVDNAGLPLVASVRFCPVGGPCPWGNAAWSGAIDQMVFGAGYVEDDIAAHELTHGVTHFESQFLYFFQSGALSEMMSDVFGEFVDLVNGRGNDDPSVRWLIGEDYVGGAARSMANPPAYGQPDRMQSSLYYSGDEDNFGVHFNSGVGNKAAYLLTDGGTFNGHVVGSIGLEKTARIFYIANTTLLTSGSDFADLYDDLRQACTASIGTAGITSADCVQVGEAVAATEMNLQPVTGAAVPDAPVCAAGAAPEDLFTDDFEAGLGGWTAGALVGSNVWSWEDLYATDGTHHLIGEDAGSTTDSYVTMNTGVLLPAGQTFLRFAHFHSFEIYGTSPADGGVVEYSVNGGTTWQDAASLFVDNPYGGTIGTLYGNPLGGRMAFTGLTRGYTSSRLALATLAGETVMFRFRIGTDSSVGADGWFIDDVRIYACITPSAPTVPGPPSGVVASPGNAAAQVAWAAPVDDGGSPITAYTATASPGGATCSTTGALSCIVSGLTNGTAYTFTVTATNAIGTGPASTASASVTPAAVPPTASITPLPTWRASTSIPLTWGATPGSAAVASYDVRYQRAAWNGSFRSYVTWRSATTATSATFPGSSGSTYCFSVRARDTLGGLSAWTANTCMAVPLDDRSLTRSGRWTKGTGATYYRSTYLRSYTSGAKLVRTGVVARRIAIVATTCSTCGRVKVYWGSTLLQTISLRSATTVHRKIITVKTFTSARRGTLTIKVYSSGKKVLIDGVAIRRN